mmetsp:Transcript_98133/g.263764  ORF Transcript_98133/g.263764 Transcript_98133/m.263764 type:complete len:110 (-) Transcript_98133:1880-2209(-)
MEHTISFDFTLKLKTGVNILGKLRSDRYPRSRNGNFMPHVHAGSRNKITPPATALLEAMSLKLPGPACRPVRLVLLGVRRGPEAAAAAAGASRRAEAPARSSHFSEGQT